MQKTVYMTDETWQQLQYIAGEDRSFSDVIRELIYLAYYDKIGDEVGSGVLKHETLEGKKV